jgi:hypothetical protein
MGSRIALKSAAPQIPAAFRMVSRTPEVRDRWGTPRAEPRVPLLSQNPLRVADKVFDDLETVFYPALILAGAGALAYGFIRLMP